jgi:hypothetical protein
MKKEYNKKDYDVIVKSEIYFIRKDKKTSSINNTKPKLISCHRITRDMLKDKKEISQLLNKIIEQHTLDLKIQIRKREIDELLYEIS